MSEEGSATTTEQLPNVRVHLRGGQTIETRIREFSTRVDANADLTYFERVGTEPGWPKLSYVRLDAVDLIEWIDR